MFRKLLLAASLALPMTVSAQTMVAKTITFTGAPQSQAELLTLSGLTPGKTLSKDDIDAAANRLDASGLFASVQWSTASGALTFALEPSAKAQMQQVRYQNFVWYTQAELNDAVHAKLPLFTGSVPANGELKDQVAHALVELLKQRGVEATVDSQGVVGGKLEYRIVSPPVIVSDIQIENIRWDSDPVLESVRHAMVNVEYLEGLSQQGVHENLGYALKELGFLDESVGPIGHGEPKLEAGKINVVMTGAATPGSRYKVARVTFPAPVGTVTANEIETSDNQIKAGGLPSPSLVQNTTLRMAFVFQGHGFLDAKASVEPIKDPVAHTMSYTFAVAPGEVYHMRELLFAADLSEDQKAQLTKEWKLPKGAVYERMTVARTLATLKTLCAGRPAMDKLIPSPATHEVDVSLSCKPQR
jgi:outer membrane protein assembly factor BamA